MQVLPIPRFAARAGQTLRHYLKPVSAVVVVVVVVLQALTTTVPRVVLAAVAAVFLDQARARAGREPAVRVTRVAMVGQMARLSALLAVAVAQVRRAAIIRRLLVALAATALRSSDQITAAAAAAEVTTPQLPQVEAGAAVQVGILSQL